MRDVRKTRRGPPARRRLAQWLALAAVLIGITGMTATAEAGHYYIIDLNLYTRAQIIELRDNGIQTTEHFLAATLTKDARAALAKKVSLEEKEIERFARVCELLQINGVGPKMAELLQEAGVTNVKDFASRKQGDLHQRLVTVNKSKKITGVDPPPDLVGQWITSAKKAKYHVK